MAPSTSRPAAPPVGAPPARRPPRPPRPPGGRRSVPPSPPFPRPRASAPRSLLGIASAIGIVIALATSIGSGSAPGFGGGGLRAQANGARRCPRRLAHAQRRARARRHQAPPRVARARSNWHSFGEGSSDGDGAFAVKGRVLERPGRVQVRARVPGVATTTPVAIVVRPLRLDAVGDINLDGAPAAAWQSVGRALRSADLSFGNLESAVSTRGTPFQKDYNFRAPPAALASMAHHSGIDVLNLAQQPHQRLRPARARGHCQRRRAPGHQGRRRRRQPQARPGPAGRPPARAQGRLRRLLRDRAHRVHGRRRPPGHRLGRIRSEIVDAIRAARRKADIVVATFHWGIEKQTLETARQRQLADVAVRAGAQVVVGAHPHTLQPVRRQGGAIVAFAGQLRLRRAVGRNHDYRHPPARPDRRRRDTGELARRPHLRWPAVADQAAPKTPSDARPARDGSRRQSPRALSRPAATLYRMARPGPRISDAGPRTRAHRP